jgi:FkbM family methyltransferase
MDIGGRDPRRIARAASSPAQWRAVLGMPSVYGPRQLAPTLGRFLLARGDYPTTLDVKTPLGPFRVDLQHRDDLLTVNEIFVRRDYASPETIKVAVDVGANVGIASLYFLTRNAAVRSYCVEPNPHNVARLRPLLAQFEGRYELFEVAASDTDGEATFFVEPTGRYGGFEQGWKEESITVPTRSFEALLGEVLEREERIDVLKVDTEGSEEMLVSGIPQAQLDRIDRIYYETDGPEPFHLDRYRHHFDCQTNALIRHGLAA